MDIFWVNVECQRLWSLWHSGAIQIRLLLLYYYIAFSKWMCISYQFLPSTWPGRKWHGLSAARFSCKMPSIQVWVRRICITHHKQRGKTGNLLSYIGRCMDLYMASSLLQKLGIKFCISFSTDTACWLTERHPACKNPMPIIAKVSPKFGTGTWKERN